MVWLRTLGTIAAIAQVLFFLPEAKATPPQGAATENNARVTQQSDRRTARISAVSGLRHPAAYDRRKGIILFEAKVNGRSIVALLDNQTARSLIAADLVAELKLPVEPSKTIVGTLNGKEPAWGVVSGITFEITGQLQIMAPFTVYDLAAMSRIVGHPIGLVLGGEYFAALGFAIDPQAGTFTVGPGGTRRPGAAYQALPLLNDRSQVAVEIGGKQYVLTVDLGFNGGIALKAEDLDAAASTLREERRTTADIAGRPRSVRQRRSAIRIGDVDMLDVPISDGSTREVDGDGLLGMAVLAQSPFVLDVKAHTLWLGRVAMRVGPISPQ